MATDIAQFFCSIEKNQGLYDDKVALQKIFLSRMQKRIPHTYESPVPKEKDVSKI